MMYQGKARARRAAAALSVVAGLVVLAPPPSAVADPMGECPGRDGRTQGYPMVYLPDGDNPAAYYLCLDAGRVQKYTCPGGTYFVPWMLRCVQPRAGDGPGAYPGIGGPSLGDGDWATAGEWAAG